MATKLVYDNLGSLRRFAFGEQSFEDLNREFLRNSLRRDGYTEAEIDRQMSEVLERNNQSLSKFLFGEDATTAEAEERIARIVRRGLANNKEFSEIMADIDVESGIELPDLWENAEEGDFFGGGEGGIVEGEDTPLIRRQPLKPSDTLVDIEKRTNELLGIKEDDQAGAGGGDIEGGVEETKGAEGGDFEDVDLDFEETEPLLEKGAAEEVEKPSWFDSLFKPSRKEAVKDSIFDPERQAETDALLDPEDAAEQSEDVFGREQGAMMGQGEYESGQFETGTEKMTKGGLKGAGEGAEDVYVTTTPKGTLLERDIEKTIQTMIDAGEITGEGAIGAAEQEVIIDNVIKNLGEGAGIETALETGVSTAGYTFVEGAGSLGVGLLISAIDGTGSQAVDIGLASAGTLGVTTAAAFAPETLGMSLIVGGALYGVIKGVEAIGTAAGVGREAQKKYHYEQNEQKGSHEMDEKEINYALNEVNSGIKYYEDQVKYHYSVSNKDPKAIAKHEQDKQMLQTLKETKASLEKGKAGTEPVYVMVGDGFNEDNLSAEDKKTYDELVAKVDRARDKVYYHGGDRARLERKEAELQEFIEQNSNSAMPTNYVNAASQEQIDQANENYIKYGVEAYGNLTPEQLDLLGYTAGRTDEVESERLKVENAQVQAKEELAKLKAEEAGFVVGGGSVM